MKSTKTRRRWTRYCLALIPLALALLVLVRSTRSQEDDAPAAPADNRIVQSYQLEKESVKERAALVRKIFGADKNVQIEVDEKTNGIIVRGRRETVEAIERLFKHLTDGSGKEEAKVVPEILALELERQILLQQVRPGHPKLRQVEWQLDTVRKHLKAQLANQPQPANLTPKANDNALADPHRGIHMHIGTNNCLKCHVMEGLDHAGTATSRFSIDHLRGEFQRLERAAIELAAKPDAKEEDVRAAVTKAFDARQGLQTAEIMKTRSELEHVAQRLLRRDVLKTKIIDRRVTELLSGDLKWEPQPTRGNLQNARNALNTRPNAASATTSLDNAPEPIKFRALLREAMERTAVAQRQLDQLSKDAKGSDADARRARLTAAKQDLDLLKQVYRSKIEQLKVDVDRAGGQLAAAKETAALAKEQNAAGQTTSIELRRLLHEERNAALLLKRAHAELEIYNEVGKAIFD